MRVPNLELMIAKAEYPTRFKSNRGEEYDGWYASVPGDTCVNCGKTFIGHVLKDYGDGRRKVYLECIRER